MRSVLGNRASKAAVFAMWVVSLGLMSITAVAGDFDTASDDWHGLSGFLEVFDVQDVEVMEVESLNWEDIDSDDALVVIYPTDELDVGSLSSFVIDGGRVMIADDFGASRPFLERLDIERSEPAAEELPHTDFIDDHPGWPRFSVGSGHPLIEGVDEVVANYPAVLHNRGGPVVAYGEAGGLVYDMELGEGRAVVVADPGLFINAMLPAADNRRLAFNTAHHLCSDVDECRVWLVVEDIDFEGAYVADGAGDSQRGALADRIEEFNEAIQKVFRELPETSLLYFAVIFLVIGTTIYLATVFPWRRARRLSDYMERQRRELSGPLTEFDWNVERFVDPDGRINHALPMAILKESFEEVFFAEFDLGAPATGQGPSIGVLAKRFEERYLRGESPKVRNRRRRDVESLLATLETVPDRHRVFLESEEYYSARDLERLYARIRRVLQWMGLEDAYERRTRRIYDRDLRSRR